MSACIARVSLLVPDYAPGLDFYVGVLGFALVEDTPLPEPGRRWVVVAPPGGRDCALLLARASNEAQRACIGRQAGGRVFLFLHTDDFWRDHARFTQRGVRFVRAPRCEPYGTVAVFEDPFGTLWDLIGPPAADGSPPSTAENRHPAS